MWHSRGAAGVAPTPPGTGRMEAAVCPHQTRAIREGPFLTCMSAAQTPRPLHPFLTQEASAPPARDLGSAAGAPAAGAAGCSTPPGYMVRTPGCGSSRRHCPSASRTGSRCRNTPNANPSHMGTSFGFQCFSPKPTRLRFARRGLMGMPEPGYSQTAPWWNTRVHHHFALRGQGGSSPLLHGALQ